VAGTVRLLDEPVPVTTHTSPFMSMKTTLPSLSISDFGGFFIPKNLAKPLPRGKTNHRRNQSWHCGN
jgi:hypothetical protein